MASEDELTLVDRWEQLGRKHQMETRTEHDAWPRAVCWTRTLTWCSCGVQYPAVSATTAEVRSSAHLSQYVDSHRQLHHMKHLVAQLLDEDWVPESKYIDWIPQEQA